MLTTTRRNVNATWLNRLRWFAFTGQLLTIALASVVMSVALPLGALGIVLAVEVVFALSAEWATRRGMLDAAGPLFATMVGDVLVLTGLLYFAGGPENPFNFLYLVHVTLALVVAGERAAWALLALCSLLFGSLFAWHVPLHMHGMDVHAAMGLHMQGMWAGFVVAGVSIVGFLSRLSRAVAERDAELIEAHNRIQQAERLASLATLAAGAAHELNTPLSTIALVAREVEVSAREAGPHGAAILEDAALIRSEIERCRTILEQLSIDAGHASGASAEQIAVADLLHGCAGIENSRITLAVEAGLGTQRVALPVRPLRRALSAVLDNALATNGEVKIDVRRDEDDLVIVIQDTGPGMTPEVLARAFEPFFTTRSTGRGMGLGLFLARSVVQALDGTLTVESTVASGSCATFRLPLFGDLR